jgi:AcrR family transcriptional regulator
MPKLASATRQQRRQEFIAAAWKCAVHSGYRDLTIADVCAEAGVSKGAFYVYFPSKRDLLLALLDDEATGWDQLMDEFASSGASPRARLRLFTRAMLERADDPALVQVRADLWTAMLTEVEVRDRFVKAMERRRTRLREWIREGVESGELRAIPDNAFASILLALGDGLLLHGAVAPAGFRWSNIRQALDVLLEGISRP